MSTIEFLYKKKYITRHKILKALQNYCDKVTAKGKPEDTLSFEDIALNVKQISEATNLDQCLILPELEVLEDRKQIHFGDDPINISYFITKLGSVAFYDETYLEDGKKSLITIVKDCLSIITTIGLFIIALYTFFNNIIKTDSNSSEIKLLKEKVEQIEKKH